MLSWEERRQLVKTANLYYTEGWTQEQIAKRVGVSRPVISKLLQKAKDYGIVEIFIKDESLHTVDLEQQLEEKFGLKDVVVVPSKDGNSEMTKQAVGQAAASYISKKLKDVQMIGIGWGSLLAEMVKEFPFEKKESIKIVPLVGGMGMQHVGMHANQLAYELAKKLNGTCSYLYVPAFIESKELRDRLINMSDVKAVLEEGRKVDMAVVGIGNPYDQSTLKKIGYLSEEDIGKLKENGVVGDITSRFLHIDGTPLENDINEKIIGVTLDEIKAINLVIGVAEGAHKRESILGALNGHYLDVLIIDELAASAILSK